MMMTKNEESIRKYCDQIVSMRTFNRPQAQYLGNGNWIIVLSETLEVISRCKKSTKAETFTVGITHFQLDIGCSAHTKFFNLPMFQRFDSQVRISGDFGSVAATRDVWRSILSDLDNSTDSIPVAIDSSPAVPDMRYRMSALRAQIEHLKADRTPEHAAGMTLGIVLVLVTLAAAMVVVRCRRHLKQPHCVRSSPAPSPTVSTNPTPAEAPVEAQTEAPSALPLTCLRGRVKPNNTAAVMTSAPATR